MHLSDKTISILKNFSGINESLLFRQGNVVRTIAPGKAVIAKATLEESFEKDFGIFNLSRFLGVISLFDKPDVTLGDTSLSIKAGRTKLRYTYADPTTFATIMKDLNVPEPIVSFPLKGEVLQKILKAGTVLQMPEVAFVGDGKTVTVKAFDSTKDEASDQFSTEVADSDKTFKAVFKVANLKMIPADYTVSLAKKDDNAICRFESPNLTYWVALEAKPSRL